MEPPSIKAVLASNETKIEELQTVATFAKKLAALEESYGRDLGKLVDKFLPADRVGSLNYAPDVDSLPLSVTFACVLDASRQRAELHTAAAAALQSRVAAPLLEQIAELEKMRNMARSAGQRDFKQLHDLVTALRSAQDAHAKDKKAHDEAASSLQRAESANKKVKELQKLREKHEGASAKLAATGETLASREAECAEQQRIMYQERVPMLLQQYRLHDERRALVLLTALDNTHNVTRERADGYGALAGSLGGALRLADAELESQEFNAAVASGSDVGSGAVSAMSVRRSSSSSPVVVAVVVVVVVVALRRLLLLATTAPPSLPWQVHSARRKGRLMVGTCERAKPLHATRWHQRLCVLTERGASSDDASSGARVFCRARDLST